MCFWSQRLFDVPRLPTKTSLPLGHNMRNAALPKAMSQSRRHQPARKTRSRRPAVRPDHNRPRPPGGRVLRRADCRQEKFRGRSRIALTATNWTRRSPTRYDVEHTGEDDQIDDPGADLPDADGRDSHAGPPGRDGRGPAASSRGRRRFRTACWPATTSCRRRSACWRASATTSCGWTARSRFR